jgi:uncharacterized protein YcaQ
VFEVKALFLQDDIEPTPALAAAIAKAIGECADWHATPDVRIARCDPKPFRADLREALRARSAT